MRSERKLSERMLEDSERSAAYVGTWLELFSTSAGFLASCGALSSLTVCVEAKFWGLYGVPDARPDVAEGCFEEDRRASAGQSECVTSSCRRERPAATGSERQCFGGVRLDMWECGLGEFWRVCGGLGVAGMHSNSTAFRPPATP